MLNFKYLRVAAVVCAFAVLVLSSAASSQRTEANRQPLSVIASAAFLAEPLLPSNPLTDDQDSLEAVPAEPDSLASTSTFYSVRQDLRRCVSPMCGGYFVKRVNLPTTRCPNGRYQAECYVAEIDWNGQTQVDAGKALLRGTVIAKTYNRFGNLGVLRVTEAWQAVSDSKPSGAFYRVRDRGLRCITFPCPTHHEAKLNTTVSQNIAGVDLSALSDAHTAQAMTGPDGVVAAGDHVKVKGPGGTMLELKATQIYLRLGNGTSGMKPCIKTGCSSQICSDHTVMSTCEWKAEYACYQKAACERQADGNCGFTRTRELTACLGGK
jgi:hypothetical protein